MTRQKQSYKDIEIYTIAKELAVKVHRITLEELPKFEMGAKQFNFRAAVIKNHRVS